MTYKRYPRRRRAFRVASWWRHFTFCVKIERTMSVTVEITSFCPVEIHRSPHSHRRCFWAHTAASTRELNPGFVNTLPTWNSAVCVEISNRRHLLVAPRRPAVTWTCIPTLLQQHGFPPSAGILPRRATCPSLARVLRITSLYRTEQLSPWLGDC